MKVAELIILLITLTDAKHHHNSHRNTVPESKDSLFGNVNEAIHSLLNTLFDSINLAANFSKESNIKMLLTMHYDLNNIVDKNIDALNEIQKIIKVNVVNQTQEMIKLESVIDEIFHEKHFDLYDIITGKHRHKQVKHKIKNERAKKQYHVNITSDFSDSKEFTDFMVMFLEKTRNLTLKDIHRSSKLVKSPVPSRRNLKAWNPSSSILDTPNGTNTRRIYNGKETSISSFPFIVSIHVLGEFSCAGSIIGRGFIITAASCLQVAYQNDYFKTNLKSIYVRMGSDYTMMEGETIPVQYLYFHPEYEPEHMRNNLVIIRLERRIRFTRHQTKIRRISWDDSPGNLPEDVNEILVLGWGAKKRDQEVNTDDTLSVDVLDVYHFNRCMEAYSEHFLSKDNYCAGSLNKDGGACNGDVGGPGVVGAMLMGVISFGTPECGKSPTVFTKLGYYSQWIKSIITERDKVEDTSGMAQNARRKLNLKVIRMNVTSLTKKKRKGKKKFRTRYDDYPEEMKALKDILIELLKTDSDVIDEVLYGDIYEDLSDIVVSKENDVLTPVTTTLMPKYSVTDPTFIIESVTPINRKQSQNIMRQEPISESEEDIHNTRTENSDYTDNYERSTEEERGLSIEAVNTTLIDIPETTELKVPRATTSKKFKEDDSSTSSDISNVQTVTSRDISRESVTQISDNTSSKSKKKNKTHHKAKKYSEETENDSGETKSRSDELTTRFVPFVGTQMDLQSLNVVVGVKGSTKKTKIVHMRNNRHSYKKKLTSIYDTDKVLATPPYIYEFGSNTSVKPSSKSKNKMWNTAVELRILHG